MNKTTDEEKSAIVQAKRNIKHGKYQEALDILESLLINNTKSSTVWKLKSKILSELKDNKSAIVAVEQAIRVDPEDPHCHVLKAQLNKKMGKLNEALIEVDVCLTKWPNSVGLISIKIDLLSDLGLLKFVFEFLREIRGNKNLAKASPINMAFTRFLYSRKRFRVARSVLYFILRHNKEHEYAGSFLKRIIFEELEDLVDKGLFRKAEKVKLEYKLYSSTDDYAEVTRFLTNCLIVNKKFHCVERNIKELHDIDRHHPKTLSLEVRLDIIYGQPMKAYSKIKKVLPSWLGEEELVLTKLDLIKQLDIKSDSFGLLHAIRSQYMSSPKVLMSAARLYLYFKRYNIAHKLVSTVLESYPKHVLANNLKLTILADINRNDLYKKVYSYSELISSQYTSFTIAITHHLLSLVKDKELNDDRGLLKYWLKLLENLIDNVGRLNEEQAFYVLKKYKKYLSNEQVSAVISQISAQGVKSDYNILWMIQNIEQDMLENITWFHDRIDSSQKKYNSVSFLNLELTLMHKGPQAALNLLKTKSVKNRNPVEATELARFLMLADTKKLSLRYLRFCRRKWPHNMKINMQFARALFDRGYPRLAIGVLNKINPSNVEVTNLKVFCLLEVNEIKKAGLELNKRSLASSTNLIMTRSQFFILNKESQKAKSLLHKGYEEGLEANYLGPHSSLSLIGALLRDLELYEYEVRASYSSGCNQDLLLRYTHPSIKVVEKYVKDVNLSSCREELIPKTICQYWDKVTPPDFIVNLMATWQGQCDFSYSIYNKKTASLFISRNFDKKFLKAFRLSNNPAEEADFFRLCYLFINGGVYADADDGLYGDLNNLIPRGVRLLCFREQFGALANNFIAVSPNHPAIKLACELAAESLLSRDNESTWHKTGPGLFTRAVAYYLSSAASHASDDDLLIYPLYRLKREVKIHMKLPHKNNSNYWNSSSARKLSLA